MFALLAAMLRRSKDASPKGLAKGTRIEWRNRAGKEPEPNSTWVVTGHRNYFNVPHIELTNATTDVVKLVSLNGLFSAGSVRVLSMGDENKI